MLHRKLVEGVVAATVPLLKPLYANTTKSLDKGYEAGVLDTITAVLLTPGVAEKALYEKVKRAYAAMKDSGWHHTKLAEERIVEALLA